jgi:hypothetical protein
MNNILETVKRLREKHAGLKGACAFSVDWVELSDLLDCIEEAVELMKPFGGRDGYEQVNVFLQKWTKGEVRGEKAMICKGYDCRSTEIHGDEMCWLCYSNKTEQENNLISDDLLFQLEDCLKQHCKFWDEFGEPHSIRLEPKNIVDIIERLRSAEEALNILWAKRAVCIFAENEEHIDNFFSPISAHFDKLKVKDE